MQSKSKIQEAIEAKNIAIKAKDILESKLVGLKFEIKEEGGNFLLQSQWTWVNNYNIKENQPSKILESFQVDLDAKHLGRTLGMGEAEECVVIPHYVLPQIVKGDFNDLKKIQMERKLKQEEEFKEKNKKYIESQKEMETNLLKTKPIAQQALAVLNSKTNDKWELYPTQQGYIVQVVLGETNEVDFSKYKGIDSVISKKLGVEVTTSINYKLETQRKATSALQITQIDQIKAIAKTELAKPAPHDFLSDALTSYIEQRLKEVFGKVERGYSLDISTNPAIKIGRSMTTDQLYLDHGKYRITFEKDKNDKLVLVLLNRDLRDKDGRFQKETDETVTKAIFANAAQLVEPTGLKSAPLSLNEQEAQQVLAKQVMDFASAPPDELQGEQDLEKQVMGFASAPPLDESPKQEQQFLTNFIADKIMKGKIKLGELSVINLNPNITVGHSTFKKEYYLDYDGKYRITFDDNKNLVLLDKEENFKKVDDETAKNKIIANVALLAKEIENTPINEHIKKLNDQSKLILLTLEKDILLNIKNTNLSIQSSGLFAMFAGKSYSFEGVNWKIPTNVFDILEIIDNAKKERISKLDAINQIATRQAKLASQIAKLATRGEEGDRKESVQRYYINRLPAILAGKNPETLEKSVLPIQTVSSPGTVSGPGLFAIPNPASNEPKPKDEYIDFFTQDIMEEPVTLIALTPGGAPFSSGISYEKRTIEALIDKAQKNEIPFKEPLTGVEYPPNTKFITAPNLALKALIEAWRKENPGYKAEWEKNMTIPSPKK